MAIRINNEQAKTMNGRRVFRAFRGNGWVACTALIAVIVCSGCERDDRPSSTTSPVKTQSGKTTSAQSQTLKIRTVTPQPAPKRRWDPNGLEDFKLTESSGKDVTKADLLGKPWVANFIFTRCAGPCADLTYQMYNLQEWLETKSIDVRLVTLTVDPDNDKPAVLKRYADVHGAKSDRWWFLTGSKETLYTLIQKSFLETVIETEGANRKPGYEVIHTTVLMLVDEKGRVIGEYNGRHPKSMSKLRRRLDDWKKAGTFADETSATETSTAETSTAETSTADDSSQVPRAKR